jgi:ABC-type Fe3+ transport system substrate-binding protein
MAQHQRSGTMQAGLAVLAAALMASFWTAGASAETPASALELAKEYAMPPELMAEWEAEHKVPMGWIAGARTEGGIRFSGASRPEDFERMVVPFRERYPFVKVEYTRGNRNARVVKLLAAFREGRYITDIVAGINTRLHLFRKLDALTDLSDLPTRANIPLKLGAAATFWVGTGLRYYCLAYSPRLVKKSELPISWDDLKTNKALAGHKLADWYGVGSWLLPLWGKKGRDWTTRFVKGIFETVQAERRNEGMTALTSLAGTGEFNAVLAVAAGTVIALQKKGAPVGFHCPDTVMVNAPVAGLLNGSPNTCSGKLLLNWLLSMEGQLFQYHYTGARPIHRALQNEKFVPFPKETLGKTLAFHDPGELGDDLPRLMKIWSPYWESGGGPKGEGGARKSR